MTDPKKDEHIEELLSKLQGIFGKLSHTDEEEAKQAIEIPVPAPKESETKVTPPKKQERAPEIKESTSDKNASDPAPIHLYEEPPPATPAPTNNAPPAAPEPPAAAPAEGGYESLVPTEDPERVIIPTAVYFPIGKENEAKSLAGKLETMAPKFTKVAFRLRIIVFLPYDPKSNWKDGLVEKAAQTHFQTVFVAVDRPMEDAKKKAIVSELETNNVYLQEVPINSIEKKAFYTDILLGLVFFFDSRKPPTSSDGSAP